jgi:hypothetical protein
MNDKERKEKERALEQKYACLSIHCLIAYLRSFFEIEVFSFYDIRDLIPKLKSELLNYNKIFEREDFDIIKKKGIAYYEDNNRCKVPDNIRLILDDPHTFKIDEHELSLRAATDFKEYWNYTLLSYKQKSAYINRIKYLIDFISQYIDKPFISNYDDVRYIMLSYRDDLNNMLSSTN